jgi:hypothetical protein
MRMMLLSARLMYFRSFILCKDRRRLSRVTIDHIE